MSRTPSPIPISNYDLDDFRWEDLLNSPGTVHAGNTWNANDTLSTPSPYNSSMDVGVGAPPVPPPRTSSRLSMLGGPSGTPMVSTSLPSDTQIAGPSRSRGKSPAGPSGRLRAPSGNSSSDSSGVSGGRGRRRVGRGRRRGGGGGRRGGGGGRRGGGGGGGGGGGSGGGGGGSSDEDDTDSDATPSGRRRDRRIRDLQQELRSLLNDAGQAARGRHIAGITTTNTITTTYKDGRRPTVSRNSTYSSN